MAWIQGLMKQSLFAGKERKRKMNATEANRRAKLANAKIWEQYPPRAKPVKDFLLKQALEEIEEKVIEGRFGVKLEVGDSTMRQMIPDLTKRQLSGLVSKVKKLGYTAQVGSENVRTYLYLTW